MTKKESLLLALGFALLISAAILNYTNLPKVVFASKLTVASPLPSLLTSTFVKTLGSYHWIPSERILGATAIKKPELGATAILSYDLTTDKVLFEKNSKNRYPIASLTKIMTAIIALENEDLQKEFNVEKNAAEIGENTMGLTTGEKLTLEELLYGLILHSGNDAAETIAQGSKFGRDNFVYLMNKKAEELGLTNTNFTNPTGLEGDGNQYSSAYDLLVITEYALKKESFAKITATASHTLPLSDIHKEIYLENQTNLLTTYPGVKGVKTGFTDEAGMCLVTYLDYEGHKIVAVLLNSPNRREEMKQLLDYSLESLGTRPPFHF